MFWYLDTDEYLDPPFKDVNIFFSYLVCVLLTKINFDVLQMGPSLIWLLAMYCISTHLQDICGQTNLYSYMYMSEQR